MSVSAKPTSKLCQAVEIIKRIMEKRKYGICDGGIYKLAPDGKFTYVYCQTSKDFLLSLLGNVEIADAIVSVIGQLTGLLSESACRLIQPLQVDYNLIEVLPAGTCFNIEKKNFEVIETMEKTPRAFVKYVYDESKIPYPEKFVEGNILYNR